MILRVKIQTRNNAPALANHLMVLQYKQHQAPQKADRVQVLLAKQCFSRKRPKMLDLHTPAHSKTNREEGQHNSPE
jgi:hypothetical protein